MGCFGSNATQTDQPIQYDPLGRAANGSNLNPTGGPEQRSSIFNYLNSITPQMNAASGALASGLSTAAQNPGFSTAAGNAQKTLQGGYLGGTPEFQSSLNNYTGAVNQNASGYLSGVNKVGQGIVQRANAGAADSAANTASQLARVGQGFSTANQQAAQSGRAAAGAQASQQVADLQNQAQQAAAQMKAGAAGNVMGAQTQNYQAERARQAAGADQLNSALGAPLNYLSQVPSSLMNGVQQQAGIVSGLATGGPVATPQSLVYKQPGVMDYAMPLLGAGMAGGMG